MTKLTIKVDAGLLDKARKLALRNRSSVSAVLQHSLEDFVRRHDDREASLRRMDEFYLRSGARTGAKTWTRDELHER
jgi:predicted transcriptional regulator